MAAVVIGSTGCTGRGAGGPTAGRSAASRSEQPLADPSAQPSIETPNVWRVADSVPLRRTSVLRSVAAVDATHAWAVGGEGYSMTQPGISYVPVVERWDGQHWYRDVLPDLHWSGALQHVAADSPNDVWAVGSSDDASGNSTTHVLHFDGTAWREMPSPLDKAVADSLITDLSVAGGHAWLVGNRGSAVIIREWNGTAWLTRSPPPQCTQGGTSTGGMPNFCTYTGITAFAVDDVWAAGNGSWSGFQGPALFHWDGRQWRSVDVGGNQHLYFLNAVAGSPRDLWAVGNLFNSGTPYVVHGDGTTWTAIVGLADSLLPAVAVDGSGRPWVVSNDLTPAARLSTFAVSGSWKSTRAPWPKDAAGLELHSITSVPGTGRMFAVGQAGLPTNPREYNAVILEYVPDSSTVDSSKV
jgi:hypothetical protein